MLTTGFSLVSYLLLPCNPKAGDACANLGITDNAVEMYSSQTIIPVLPCLDIFMDGRTYHLKHYSRLQPAPLNYPYLAFL